MIDHDWRWCLWYLGVLLDEFLKGCRVRTGMLAGCQWSQARGWAGLEELTRLCGLLRLL